MRARTDPDLLSSSDGRAAPFAADGALASAFAASLAIHAGALVAASAIAAWPQATAIDAREGATPALRAVLAPPVSSPAPTPAAGRTDAGATVRLAPASSPAGNVSRTASASPSRAGGPGAGAGGTAEPRVVVDDRVPRARFGDAIDGEPLAGIPTEIDVPPRLPGRLVVSYPADALAERREGTVLAWTIVDENGTPEEPHVVEGPPEFAEAVTAALRATHFVPARDGGAPVRFYVALQFDFRIEARSAVAARAGAPAGR